MAYTFRFYAVQVCCAELGILECRLDRDGSLEITKSFSLPLEDAYLWKPQYPVYLALPSNMFFMKQLRLLCPQGVDCDFAVDFEYDKNIPFPKHSVYWSYDLLDGPAEADIEREALIFAGRAEVIDRWLGKMNGALSSPSGITPYSIAFYNLLKLLEFSLSIRQREKVSIALLCSQGFTDVVIIGENPSRDWIRTLPRGYGNVSLIWDIKELLEAYFARFSKRIGEVVLSQEIDTIYLLVNDDIKREEEWEALFEKELGVVPVPFPVNQALQQNSMEGKNIEKFALAFGLAVMFSKNKFDVLNGIIPIDVKLEYSIPGFYNILQLFLILSLISGVGYLTLKDLMPVKSLIGYVDSQIAGYRDIKNRVDKLKKKRDELVDKLALFNKAVSRQYFYPEFFSVLSSCMESLDSVVVSSISAKLIESSQNNTEQLVFSLQIVSDNYDSLNDLLINLRKSGKFSKVSAVNSRYDSDNKVTMLLVLER